MNRGAVKSPGSSPRGGLIPSTQMALPDCNSSAKESNTLFYSLGTRHAHGAQTDMQAKHPYTCNNNFNKIVILSINRDLASFDFCFLSSVLRVEPRSLCLVGKWCTSELKPCSSISFLFLHFPAKNARDVYGNVEKVDTWYNF